MLDKKKIISEFLIARGIVTAGQLEQARKMQESSDAALAELIGQQSSLHENTLAELIIEELGLAVQHLRPETRQELIPLVASPDAHRLRLVPLEFVGETLRAAIDNPLHYVELNQLSRVLGQPLEAELFGREILDELLAQYYPLAEEPAIPASGVEEGAEEEDEKPVIQLVNVLVSEAYQKRASDIHIEPLAERVRIRFRVDGLLQEVQSPAKKLERSLISRIKLMAGMNIAEKRLPQDGRIRTAVDRKEFDLRVSTLPAYYGESLVLRILDRRVMGVAELGFSPAQQELFQAMVALPHGIVLVTGPTGSGKSTTLYAVLSGIDRARKKILTVEDPVEYQISGINQVQVKTGIGLTFARVLRSMLRQAPDIIMVGEIRDRETANIAVQSALTGHLIFSTLHTNDAAGAIPRLVDMGVKPYMVAATLQAVLAQRLIRLLCPQCSQAYTPRRDELRIMELEPEQAPVSLSRARGCSHCSQTGYLGRSGIFELLMVTDAIRQLAHEQAASTAIREKARQLGMMTLKEHARKKVLNGLTTFTELVRITQSDVD